MTNAEKTQTIELVPHNPGWAAQFDAEAAEIRHILGKNCRALHHIGSTAIPGIYAKPVIDILAEVKELGKVDNLNPAFEALGYVCMGEYGIPGRRFYWKSKSKRTHHIHLFESGSSEIIRHLVFRDYMIQHLEAAQGYSWIKRCLAEQFPTDIEAYINGKAQFIRMMEYRAGVAKRDQLEAKDDIILEPYNPKWKKYALAEINAIQKTINLPFVTMEHLGGTAVEGLTAKPIIDIFIALKTIDEAQQWTKPLEALGYVDWPENPDKTHDRYFKGMPPYGIKRTHHVHIISMGEAFKQRIAFRDLLLEHADLREQYGRLKQELAARYPNNREAYTDAKALFIEKCLEKFNH